MSTFQNPLSSSTSLSLLEESMNGNEQAWSRLVHIYFPLVYGWLRQSGLQDCDAADVAQDVFGQLLKKLRMFDRSIGRFRSWLRKMTQNRMIDFNRRRMHAPELLGCDLDDFESQNVAAIDDSTVESEVLKRALIVLSDRIDPDNVKIAMEVIYKGRSAAVVAAEFGKTPGNVYTIVSRVKKRLRDELGEIEPE